MKTITKIVWVFCLFLMVSIGNAQNKTTIPLDSRVKAGVLSNGMHYYIMHNEEPKERASLYFVQNVGAILENDAQNGLAHFLEHMAFNGLEHYPGKTMLKYLEANGVKFGRDINAYTARDQTVYNLSNIPANNKNLLDSALLVLHDWSGSLLLEPDEIDAERGVIREEWRTRRNSNFRLNMQSSPYLYNHSKYAERDVIGDLDVINNFKHQELRDYYHKWYRPDQQAVVVVGDIDVDRVEKVVKEMFSAIPAKENPAERVYYSVGESKEMDFVVAKDKEAQAVILNWIFRLPADTLKDEAYMRRSLTESLFFDMLNSRLSELTREPECDALQMGLNTFSLTRTCNAAYMAVVPKDKKTNEAFELLLTELERAKRFGFEKSEMQRAKTDLLRQYEAYQKDYEKVDNETWSTQLADHFLSAQPFPSLNWEMNFANNNIPDITLDEINQIFTYFDNVNNSVIVVKGPENDEIVYPTKEALLKIIEKVKQENLEPYEDNASDEPLVSEALSEKAIASKAKIEGFDATMYTLENGAKVILYPTELSKDEILFSAHSYGGLSLVDRTDLESAEMATSIASMSGLGNFTSVQLSKKLTGKVVSLNGSLDTYSEGFGGSASPQDFETMLQLLYLKFMHPRFDTATFQTIQGMLQNRLLYNKADNSKAFNDTISLLSSNYSDRTLLFDSTFVANIDLNKAERVYKDRFQDASDFTFIFVGNINVEKDLPLIQKYIGNITATNRKESWKDHHEKPAKGLTERVIEREMEVSKATVYYSIYNDIKYNLKNRLCVSIIADLLNKRYLETIREKEGGSYGVSVSPATTKLPYSHASITMKFDCDPEKQERLTAILKEEIEGLVKNGPIASDMQEIKQSYIKRRDELEHQNAYWLGAIHNVVVREQPMVDQSEYTEIVNGISAADIQKFAKQFFKKYDAVEAIMLPIK